MDKVFIERINESNVFTDVEKSIIIENKEIYEKCYLLGAIDKLKSNS